MIERVLSAWAWVAAVLLVLFGFFYVAAVWVVTAPFDRGRYQAGRAFRRLAVSQQIGALRAASGGTRLSLSREQQVLARFRAALGPDGAALGMLLLRQGRGRL